MLTGAPRRARAVVQIEDGNRDNTCRTHAHAHEPQIFEMAGPTTTRQRQVPRAAGFVSTSHFLYHGMLRQMSGSAATFSYGRRHVLLWRP